MPFSHDSFRIGSSLPIYGGMPRLDVIARPATDREIRTFRNNAPPEVIDRVARQRVIAEMLEKAAEKAEDEGRTREAHELREQAAEARAVADRVITERAAAR